MKILVADDHLLIRQGLRPLLSALADRVDVVEAWDLPTLTAALEHDPDVDLALVDLQMPGMRGAATIGLLCDRWPLLPVLVLSAGESGPEVRATLAAGAAGYVPKSASAAVLMNAVRQVLAGERYLPPLLVASGGDAAVPAAQASGTAWTGAVAGGAAGGVAAGAAGAAADGSLPTRAPGAAAAPAARSLSRRQREVLALLAEGLTNKMIARRLGLVEGTVKSHLVQIFGVLGVSNRTAAAVAARRLHDDDTPRR